MSPEVSVAARTRRVSPLVFPVVLLLLSPLPAQEQPGEFRFHRDDVLGTSLDLTVRAASRERADAVEKAVLEEIARLNGILSTYDANSEISRLKSATGPTKCSPELLEVLESCETWRTRSGGAFSAQLGPLISLWKQAEKDNKLPDDAKLSGVVRQIAQPTWRLDKAAGTVAPLPGFSPNVDALAKGYIVDKALAAARAKDSSLVGLLVDIGGDLRVWGSASSEANAPWLVGVTDPKQPQENAPPLATLKLSDRSVATSGHYARHYTIDGKRYSHIFDPRTGKPVEGILGATAVAKDCATADVLATILCVCPPEVGLNIVRSVPGADCLIIAPDGKQFVSPGWKALVAAGSASTQPGPTASSQPTGIAWPKGYQLAVSLTLPKVRNRPYVAVWVEDAKGGPVRTLTVWGGERKYLKDLTIWWSFAGKDGNLVKGVTRASRSAGKYDLVWDGLDDKGKPVPPGTYVVHVETAREEGPHTHLKGNIECGAAKAGGQITPNKEVTEVLLNYGPAGEK
jgi:thiamine biosynthesis lipoprotein ApbE